MSKALIHRLLKPAPWPPSQLFDWLLDDGLADLTGLGKCKSHPPPREAIPLIRERAIEDARCVAEHPPFEDRLSPVFAEVAHRGGQQALGQFFTPPQVAWLMVEMSNMDCFTPHRLKTSRPCGRPAIPLHHNDL